MGAPVTPWIDLVISTVNRIQEGLAAAGLEVVRVISSGGVVGLSNPDQDLRRKGYFACVPTSFDPKMQLAVVVGGEGTALSAARQKRRSSSRF